MLGVQSTYRHAHEALWIVMGGRRVRIRKRITVEARAEGNCANLRVRAIALTSTRGVRLLSTCTLYKNCMSL